MGNSILLAALGLVSFASAIAIRLPDPLVPMLARDFGVTVELAALVSSAYALPYALGQPILGPVGDAIGKAFVMKICLAVAALATAAGMFAPDYWSLFATRVVAGLAGGGAIPIAIAMVGDRFDYKHRQVALARVIFAVVIGQLAGASLSGLIAEAWGWRMSFAGAAFVAFVALAGAVLTLETRKDAKREPFTIAGAKARYAKVLSNPRAPVCYTAVFTEGVAIYGIFPHLAALFEQRGVGGVSEAGLAIAGFGLGGLVMTTTVGLLLRAIGQLNIMRLGGLSAAFAMALTAFAQSWEMTAFAFFFLGLGFYMMHNSLQTQATELAPDARGSAVALHACFFFIGIALGPPILALGLRFLGTVPSLLIAATVCSLIGVTTAWQLKARGAPA